MRIVSYLFASLFLISCASWNSKNSLHVDQIKADIIQVMKTQEADWNRGDIKAFMEGYWKSDKLRFSSNRKTTFGWQQTYEAYLRGYPDKAAMGVLGFDIDHIDVLSKDAAVLLGKFSLEYPDRNVGGMFTLTWRKINGQWRIISDMTCG